MSFKTVSTLYNSRKNTRPDGSKWLLLRPALPSLLAFVSFGIWFCLSYGWKLRLAEDAAVAPKTSWSGPPDDSEISRLLEQNGGFIIFTVTWYSDMGDVRFEQCLETIKEARQRGYPIVIVDDSPSSEVRVVLASSGAIVQKQTYKGGKGAALREAVEISKKLPGVTPETLLCWQEAEKTGMVRGWLQVRQSYHVDTEIVFVRRNDRLFHKSYPIEQYHSETFGNWYLDAVMTQALKQQSISPRSFCAQNDCNKSAIIDWHFGPFAFQAKRSDLWTKYDRGDSYDAQVVPYVHAIRKRYKVKSITVDFELDPRMKEQEEGNVAFIEKRLKQLNGLDPLVKKAWTDEFYC